MEVHSKGMRRPGRDVCQWEGMRWVEKNICHQGQGAWCGMCE